MFFGVVTDGDLSELYLAVGVWSLVSIKVCLEVGLSKGRGDLLLVWLLRGDLILTDS